MKLIIDKNKLDRAPEMWLTRQAGYVYIIDRNNGQVSFVRAIARGLYPRFHLYLEEQADKITLNLHLDQKKPSYAGVHSHNAEYEGEVVEAEIDRIRSLINRS